MVFLKLALRGLGRHRLRTVVTLLAVALGYVLLLVYLAMHKGGHGAMIELGIRQGQAGHVVVQAKGYQQSRAAELVVPQADHYRDQIAAMLPRARVLLRVFGGGLARSSNDAVGVLFSGVEPRTERSVSAIAQAIVEGVYLDASEKAIQAAEKRPGRLWCARPGPADAPPIRRVVIGRQLAKTLRVGLCDKIVLDAQGLGEQESSQLRVVGLFSSGNIDLDSAFIQLSLDDAQRLLHLDESAHQIAIFVDNADRAAQIVRMLRGKGPNRTTTGSVLPDELDVLPWDKALPELAEFIWLDASSGWVFMVVIFVIIAIGVLNTVLMSVMERTRELGVMRALGMRPINTLQLVLCEGLLLGALGVLLGGALALPLLYYLQHVGIDLTLWTESGSLEMGGMAMSVMHGESSAGQLLGGAVAVFCMTLVSSLYPAIRASRLAILRAIHHV